MAVNHTTHGGAFYEDLGGARDPNNMIAFPTNGFVHKATANVWIWTRCDNAEGYHCTPSVHVESCFREAPVEDTNPLAAHCVMTKCLDVPEYLDGALECMTEHGLFHSIDTDGNKSICIYENPHDLALRADQIVIQNKDNPQLMVSAKSFEWLEGFDPQTPLEREIEWFSRITLKDITERTKNLKIYIDLAWLVGPRSTQLVRTQPGGIFYTMVGGAAGGQLTQAMKAHFYPASQSIAHATPDFLAPRIAEFFINTQWPDPYVKTLDNWSDYAFDLPRRATWHVASRAEWSVIAQSKLPFALRANLPTLAMVFEDYLDEPAKLVREVEALGDMVLPGSDRDKQPLQRIEVVERRLAKDFAELISGERDNDAATEDIVDKLKERLRAVKASEKGTGDADSSDAIIGPKAGQMARALAEHSYTRLETKHTPTLEKQNASFDELLTMVGDNFAAKCVLTKAVILATKGTRMAPYIGSNGSDYLAMLHDKKHMLAAYLGQSIAYDADLGEVPTEFRTYAYDERDTINTRDCEWDKLEPLNRCVLVVKGREAGTTFKHHDPRNVYHDGDMLTHIMDLYGKKFEALGFPRDVAKEEGLSFRGFMALIKKLQVFAMALATDEQRAAHAAIDSFVLRGYKAAAANFKRIIYGASPADKHLRAWLPAEESVVIELQQAIEIIKDTTTFRRHSAGIFGQPAQAATLAGYAVTKAPSGKGNAGNAQTSDGQAGGSQAGGKAKKGKKRGSDGQPKGAPSQSGGGSNNSRKGPAVGSSQPSGKAKANASQPSSKAVVKRIFPYEDGAFSIGKRRGSNMLPTALPHAMAT